MRIVADGALGLALQAYPGLAATGFSLGQGLVGLHQQVCRGIAGVVGREADVGHVLHVCGACFVQAVQGGFQRLGQLHRFVTHQARGEHANSPPRLRVIRFWVFGYWRRSAPVAG
jgi:hypothetical protein